MGGGIMAIAFGGPEVLAAVPVEVGEPGTGEVTVQVQAAAVNPIDVKSYSGAFLRVPALLPIRALGPVTAAVDTIGTDEAVDVSLELQGDPAALRTAAHTQRLGPHTVPDVCVGSARCVGGWRGRGGSRVG
jgi:NADPH:quinone reductase-like Zn-dependent oxidoreductase